jgi:PA14 domain
VGRHLTRWLIPLPAIVLSFWPTLVRAEAQPGLQTTYYTIDAIPPVQSTVEYPLCGSEIENNINRSYDGEPFEDCTYDLFMVHMTGFIEIPEHNTIEFMLASDDGGEITINGNTFGVWYDQGCTWTMSNELQLDAGSQPLELWMYENGGGTCVMLAWNIDNAGWEIVPDSAFTQEAVATTSSTSTSTTTTTPTTSTTVQEQTTTSSTSSSTTSTSTTLPPTTTTTTTEPVQSSTTTSVPDTTTTTTTTVASAPTTTQAPYTPPQTTTSSSSTSLPEQSTTTTSVLPEPESTVEETSTTTYLPDPDPTLPVSVPTLPAEIETPTSQPQQTPDIPQTTEAEVQSSSTTTILELDIEPDQPITDEKVEQILEALEDAAPAQIVAAIEQVLASNITTDQAVSIASSPEVLAAITQEQAEAIFEQIVVEELSVEQADELVAALNEAPTKVKKAFQETINVFTGLFDSFQMVGQTIPVGERRTLVAVSNTLVAVGASLRRRENK